MARSGGGWLSHPPLEVPLLTWRGMMSEGGDAIDHAWRRQLESPKTQAKDPLTVRPPRATHASEITREMTMRRREAEEAALKQKAVSEGKTSYREYKKAKAERERRDAELEKKIKEGELQKFRYEEQQRMEGLSQGPGKDVANLQSLGSSFKRNASVRSGGSSGHAGVLLMPGSGGSFSKGQGQLQGGSFKGLQRADSTRVTDERILREERDEFVHNTYCIIFDVHHAKWLTRVAQFTAYFQAAVTLAQISAILAGPHRSNFQAATILLSVFEVLPFSLRAPISSQPRCGERRL